MLRRVTFVLLVGLCTSATAQRKPATPRPTAQPQPAAVSDSASSARLPVKRVVLYKNGIGYFEHNARVHGNHRHFAKYLSTLTLAIGYLMVAFDGRTLGLHDQIAGPLVRHRSSSS